LLVEDDNSLGTHEFIQLCRLLGAEPYLAGNVGSGTVQELCDWLEYCNSAVPTKLLRSMIEPSSRRRVPPACPVSRTWHEPQVTAVRMPEP
jgi:hypothetical protein